MKLFRQSIAMLAVFLTFACVYAGVVLIVGTIFFPSQAGGSFAVDNGIIRGSFLLGQEFLSPAFFHGRPSASGYDPTAGAGSNLGPSSASLAKQVSRRRESLLAENGAQAAEPPPELLLASGSGLDPEISPQAALYQIPRISRALGKSVDEELATIVSAFTRRRFFGILGEERVNVLRLNLEIERRYGK